MLQDTILSGTMKSKNVTSHIKEGGRDREKITAIFLIFILAALIMADASLSMTH